MKWSQVDVWVRGTWICCLDFRGLLTPPGSLSVPYHNPFSLLFFSCLSLNSLFLSPCLWVSLSQSLASSFWPTDYLSVRIQPHWFIQGCENSGVKTESTSHFHLSIKGSWNPRNSYPHSLRTLGSEIWKKILFKKKVIEIQLIYNVALASDGEQGESVYIHIDPLLFKILFPYRTLQSAE